MLHNFSRFEVLRNVSVANEFFVLEVFQAAAEAWGEYP